MSQAKYIFIAMKSEGGSQGGEQTEYKLKEGQEKMEERISGQRERVDYLIIWGQLHNHLEQN